jgi:hypothetical protein
MPESKRSRCWFARGLRGVAVLLLLVGFCVSLGCEDKTPTQGGVVNDNQKRRMPK